MYITWLGHSCFRLESAGYGLVIDPYRVVAGYPPLRVEANAVYISHHHFDHDCLEAVTLLPGGENPFTVETFSTFHDDCQGALRGDNTVLVTTSLVHVAEAGKVLSTVLPMAAALIFAFAMTAAWLFSEWFTKPLRQLSSAARQMAMGNYAVQVDTRRSDELGDLARDFNHMASEVQHSSQMQRDLLANVSHDLRTPLTLIKGYAETVRDITGDDKAHRDEQMNIIVDETDRLTALVSSVMELSKVTSGADKCERVHFDMGQLCDEVSERYDAICAQNGWQLQLELPDEELPVYADPNMMQRALHNLLGNAMHHIGKDGIFILRAQRCTEGVRIEVEDHGPGISADDLPYIFDRYYRSRSDAGKQGTGLGLSITKAIFQQHGFRFGVQSAIGMGTTFWFIMNDLPANAAEMAGQE